MKNNVFALIVHGRAEPCESLKALLKCLGVDTFSVSSCAEAAHLLEQTQPRLLFIDTAIPDGTWIDVLNLAADAPAPICAILVGTSRSLQLRRTALGYGAYEYLGSPFEAESVAPVLQRAIRFVQAGRERLARAVVA